MEQKKLTKEFPTCYFHCLRHKQYLVSLRILLLSYSWSCLH